MEKCKRIILVHVPVTTCNLKCAYCYITQNNAWKEALPTFKYDADYIAKALSKERLGGPCYINLCGGGETLLPPEIIDISRKLLEQGHYIEIVTNGTLTKRFEQIALFPHELLNRLNFKFSFHYKELLRLHKTDDFFANVQKMRQQGCSFTVELAAYDALIPEIDTIKRLCEENLGAACVLTICRDDTKKDTPILSTYSIAELKEKWSPFESDMYNYKLSTFYIKRKEFCYAGDWSLYINLGSGVATQCYKSLIHQNIFDDLSKPIKFRPIGYFCQEPHCYNSHMLLTCGLIPSLSTPTYAEMKNRQCFDGTEWLQNDVKYFYSSKLAESNAEYGKIKKAWHTLTSQAFLFARSGKRILRKLKCIK